MEEILFRRLCEDIGSLAGFLGTEPEEVDEGGLASVFAFNGVEVQLACVPKESPGVFCSRVDFGEIESFAEPLTWEAILTSNYFMFEAGVAFCRDPWDGRLYLQKRWPADIPVHKLLETLDRQCSLAAEFSTEGNAGLGDLTADQDEPQGAGDDGGFAAFLGSVCAAKGLEPPPVPRSVRGTACVTFMTEATEVTIEHVLADPRRLRLRTVLFAADEVTELLCRALAQANTWLVSVAGMPSICIHPISLDVVLRSNLLLGSEEASASIFLADVDRLSALAANLRSEAFESEMLTAPVAQNA